MPGILAICPNCGIIQTNAIHLGSGVRGMIHNVSVSCPFCKGMATVPDGVYGAIGNTLRVMASSPDSAKKLRTLVEILRQQTTVEDIEKTIKERAPELGQVVESLQAGDKKDIQKLIQTICAIIAVILTAIPYFTGLLGISSNPSQKDVDRILERAIAEAHGEQSSVPRNRHERRSAKHISKRKPTRR